GICVPVLHAATGCDSWPGSAAAGKDWWWSGPAGADLWRASQGSRQNSHGTDNIAAIARAYDAYNSLRILARRSLRRGIHQILEGRNCRAADWADRIEGFRDAAPAVHTSWFGGVGGSVVGACAQHHRGTSLWD